MSVVGYIPYADVVSSMEAGWVASAFSCHVRILAGSPSLNIASFSQMPSFESVRDALRPLLPLPWVIAEGPGGFVWAALLRGQGFRGGVTILPYINPRRWYDVACTAVYRRFGNPKDRILLGSTPSAAIYRALKIPADVGEPYGIDHEVFGLRSNPGNALEALSIPKGRILLFAGRAQPDKDIHALLRAALRARLLFPDLQLVIASHVVDESYMAVGKELSAAPYIHLVRGLDRHQLADLYNVADAFVTASTSHFETFGRAPAEALACGTPAIAPRYDGFVEVLAQVGGRLVDVGVNQGVPQVSEEPLLRAIFDVLSASRPPSRKAIAVAAARRFNRRNTIRLLRHAVSERSDPPRRQKIPPARLVLPPSWVEAIEASSSLAPKDLFSWFWSEETHEGLGVHDDHFAFSVRLNLCQLPPGVERLKGRAPCL